MGRLACLIVRSNTGEFLDGVTGRPIACVAEGNDVQRLVDTYVALRANKTVRRGKDDIGLSEIRVLANHTAGGELKAPCRFR
jgi:hypothetical protein